MLDSLKSKHNLTDDSRMMMPERKMDNKIKTVWKLNLPIGIDTKMCT